MKSQAAYIILALLVIALFIRGILPAWREVHSDFANYFVSSRLVVEHEPLDQLYDNAWFQQKIKDHALFTPGKFSPFPPLTAWIMLPLTFTTPLTAMRIWMVINLVLLVFCVAWVKRLTKWSWVNSGLLMMACGQGLFNNIAFGQVYLLVTAGWLMVLWLDKVKRNQLAGVLLGLLTWLKYVPAALLAGFVLLKNKTIILSTGISILILLVIQFWIFGFEVMNDFFQTALLPHLDSNLEGQNMYSFYFQSWDSLFRNLFVFSPEDNPEPFISWTSGRLIGKGIIYLSVLFSLVTVMAKLMSSKISSQATSPVILALPVFAAFVILPATATYHFLLLAVPIILLLTTDFFIRNQKTGFTVIYVLIGFIPYGLCFRMSSAAGLVFAYPRLWLISILYIAILLSIHRNVNPRKAVEKM